MTLRLAHRALRAILLLAVLAAAWWLPSPARAHEIKPAVLSLREVEPDRFAFVWSPPIGQRDLSVPMTPTFPAHCTTAAEHVDCGGRGLAGVIQFVGLESSVYRVVVQIVWLDGTTRTEVVTEKRPSLEVHALGRDAGSGALAALALAYAKLGIEHIATGFDHLLFVLGLMLLVGYRGLLIWTITAFTLAHSLTLAAGVLGIVAVPSAPVEAVIALSILLVAVECLRPGRSLTRRAPWAVAFGFGLLHGFGFAGALAELGLPRGQVSLALASFNIGVELGQLAVIALALMIWKAASRIWERAAVLEKPLVYLMGSAAAYWTIERLVSLFWSPA
jgi:hypothetical protein